MTTTATYSFTREVKKANKKYGYTLPTMTVARHVALTTVTIPFEDMPDGNVLECVAEGDERFEAGNTFGLVAGTRFYLVACKSVISGRVYQTFLNRYYVVVERNGKFVASCQRSTSDTLVAKVVAQVERFIAAQEPVVVEEAPVVNDAQKHLEHALLLIAQTRPSWQGERVRVA